MSVCLGVSIARALRATLSPCASFLAHTIDICAYIAAWVEEHVDDAERERFREVVERELLRLHDGNFSRYRVRPSEFSSWQANRYGQELFGLRLGQRGDADFSARAVKASVGETGTPSSAHQGIRVWR